MYTTVLTVFIEHIGVDATSGGDVAELAQRFQLHLPGAFPGKADFLADSFQGGALVAVKSKAPLQYFPLPGG